MPLLTSYTLVLTHSLTCVTSAYFLLFNPSTLLSSTPVWMLGESMHVREPKTGWTSPPSEPLAALALLLALSAITQAFFAGGLSPISASSSRTRTGSGVDLVQLGEKMFALHLYQTQWMGLAGVRVLLMGLLVGWIYVFQSDRSPGFLQSSVSGSGSGLLANRVVFTAALTDMLFWGYVWTVIREEGREAMSLVARLRDQDDHE